LNALTLIRFLPIFLSFSPSISLSLPTCEWERDGPRDGSTLFSASSSKSIRSARCSPYWYVRNCESHQPCAQEVVAEEEIYYILSSFPQEPFQTQPTYLKLSWKPILLGFLSYFVSSVRSELSHQNRAATSVENDRTSAPDQIYRLYLLKCGVG
jgi:hypothetical protein